MKRPILIGGSVTAQNAQDVLAAADGAIVSSSLMRPDYAEGDLLRWDAGLTRALVDAAAS